MSERGEPDLTRLLRDLTRELQTLQREIENRDRGSVSTRRQLTRFTSEVAIPGLILILETNIRALKLLRRAIRLAEGRDPRENRSDTAARELRDRAERLGTATLSRLDETLAEVQTSLEDGGDAEVQAMVAEARDLQQEIRDRIEQAGPEERSSAGTEEVEGDDVVADDHVTIDVDSELRTLKDDIEGAGDEPAAPSGDDSDTDPGEVGSDGDKIDYDHSADDGNGDEDNSPDGDDG